MRFGQIRFDNKLTAAVFEGDQARPVPGYSVVELIRKAEAESISLPELLSEMASRHSEPSPPAIPINPPEVWACGSTYEQAAKYRDAQRTGREEIYGYVHKQERPQIFFKGTSRVCVGPLQPVGIRPDSSLTMAEAELAIVLGRNGRILGYTLANDVSAWDLERENPLYQPQAKIYRGSCALGPVIVTPDELPSIDSLEMTCEIRRGAEQLFSGNVLLASLAREIDSLIEFLLRANPVPAGSVLLTGTGIIPSESASLAAGDTVSIRLSEIGELTNRAALI
jgi:2-dehydro-3-deoxy-D-arabinonate dehydratase